MSESGTQNSGGYFRFTKGTKAELEDGEGGMDLSLL